MPDFEDYKEAAAAVKNPLTTPADLNKIAHQQPDLRVKVAAHPNAYPVLLRWLDSVGDDDVKAAVAARRDSDAEAAKPSPETGGQTLEQMAPSNHTSAIAIAALILSIVAVVASGTLFTVLQVNGAIDWSFGRPSGNTTQVNPPDGDSQHAWITVPSSATNPNSMIVDIHFDYQCPYCGILEKTYDTMFESLSDRGDIVLRYHTRTFLDSGLQNDSSSRAAIAAACVDVADNTKYAAYHNTVFLNQPSQEGTGYTDDQLRNTFATTAGLTGKALKAFQSCYDNKQTQTFVQDVEANNLQALPNQSPPNNYLFGGKQPNTDTQGSCTGTTGAQIGVCGTPDLYAGGVEFNLGSLFNSDGTPKVSTADDLWTVLQQIASS